MAAALKDLRGIIAGSALVLSIVGFVVLVAVGHTDEGTTLLQNIGLPSLAFAVGLGSTPASGE